MIVICDIEADGIKDPQNIWCVVCKDIQTGLVHKFYGDTLKDFVAFAGNVTEFIGHNFLLYDRPALNRLLGCNIKATQVTDTLILSRLFKPRRQQGHSLERWGRFFKKPKQVHEEWDRFSMEMLERCTQDVEINYTLYKYLKKEGKRFSYQSIRTEHNLCIVLDEMKKKGWKLDVEKANKIYTKASARVQTIRNQFDDFPCLPAPNRLIGFRTRKDGSPYQSCTRPIGSGQQAVGDYTLVKWQSFNPNSPKSIRNYLDYFGWSPTELTKKGTPKISEANLDTLSEDAPQEARQIKEYLVLNSRAKMIANWLDNTGKDGRVHGTIIHIGASTDRAAHRDPNTANIPALLDRRGRPAIYGRECRECWTVERPNRLLVGADASGIQLRVLAHLANSQEFIERVLAPKPDDVHMQHAGQLGISREQSKTFIYAWILGAGAGKVGQIVGGTAKDGADIKRLFLAKNPFLKKVKYQLKLDAKRGYYRALDGRCIPVDSEHFAMAAALQGEETVLMRKAIIRWRNWAKVEGIDAYLVGWIHDEVQIDSHERCADDAGQSFVETIEEAGRLLKFRLPMTGEYKKGLTWAETH